MLKSWSRQAPTMLVGLLLVGAVFAGQSAFADHEPANKVAAAGSEVEVLGPGQAVPVLSQTVKMSGPTDLILSASAECDILTDLTTGGNGEESDNAGAFGEVKMWITIDDKVVPVSTDDVTETGKVVFCNRAHNKTITDKEDNTPPDGTDEERDMTQTRQANAFNWLAIDTGFAYDNPANGNNILDIVLWATLTEETVNRAEAEALIGHRTLIAEPTNASVHETVDAGGE